MTPAKKTMTQKANQSLMFQQHTQAEAEKLQKFLNTEYLQLPL